jgi:hypothetical protein
VRNETPSAFPVSRLRLRLGACLIVSVSLNAGTAWAVIPRDHRTPSTSGDVWTAEANFITDVVVQLSGGQEVVFQTTDVSPRGDPILHLLAPRPSENGPVTQVAMDDDGGGSLNAMLRFTPPRDGVYRLILRATWGGGNGTCRLLRDGAVMFNEVRFGADLRRYANLRVGEVLETAQLPNGLATLPALYLVNDDGVILSRHISYGTNVVASLGTAYRLVNVLAGSWLPLGTPGPMRVVRNDVAFSDHDPDGDGLGTELEQWIGTCSTTSGISGNWECSRATDARDTDGDALSDGLELLGNNDISPPQLLSRWGADPRHKDIFIEVDYGKKSATDPDQRMSADVARQMAAAYAETNGPLSPLDALLHAQVLNNPDLTPGIRLHLDTGLAPERPEDASIYGDWGGHDAVPPICDDTNGCRGMPAADAYNANFIAPARKGLFRYTTSYAGGGGQCGLGAIACSWSHTSVWTATHEFGHTLGLHHYGPASNQPEANCKVNYPSLMNYTMVTVGSSDADGNLKFSDGTRRPNINNASLRERAAIEDPQTERHQAMLLRLRDVYGYLVDVTTGDVDWNRDGIIQDGLVAAYSNSKDNGNCEFTSTNRMVLQAEGAIQPAATLRSPAIARLGSFIFMLSVGNDHRLTMFMTTPNPFHCAAGDGCPGTSVIEVPINTSWNHDVERVDAHRVVDADGLGLMVVFTDSQGRLWQTKMRVVFVFPVFSSATQIATANLVAEEVSLTGADDHLWLAYGDASGRVWFRRRPSSTGVWGAERRARNETGTALPAVPSSTSAAIYEAPDGTLYGAFPQQATGSGNGHLQIRRYRPADRRWEDAHLWSSFQGSFGKPAFAWRPFPSGAALPGRLFVYWTPRNWDDTRGALKEQWMVRHPDGTVHMNFSNLHSNVWFAAHGVAALFEPGVDDNVRLVAAFVVSNPQSPIPNGALEVRPRADGIVDLVQMDRNDWERLGSEFCRTLASQQGPGSITCAQ